MSCLSKEYMAGIHTMIYIALFLIVLFYILLYTGVLEKMPSSGGMARYFEHALGILLLAIPKPDLFPFKDIVWLLWATGIVLYVDDFYQHWKRKTEPNYTSPIHQWGWYVLRPWLLNIWERLK